MKKFIKNIMLLTVLIALMTLNTAFSQGPTPPDVDNYTCGSAYCLSDEASDFSFHLEEGQYLYFRFHWTLIAVNSYECLRLDFNITGVDIGQGNYELYGPFTDAPQNLCDQIDSYSNNQYIQNTFEPLIVPTQSGFQLTNNNVYYNGLTSGYFLLKINPGVLTGQISFYGAFSPNCFSCQPANTIPCEDCVTSFMPSKGTYMVSAWVKEVHSGNQPVTYEDSELKISFTGSSVEYFLTPSGQIIDGWQRIEGEIIIPSDATDIHIAFVATGELDCYFDDIRFFPYNGSMMSYVYDPRTLRLMAQLDERNYATLYEYDEEGKLIRVKKETERGIMTIQENRDNIVKKP